MNRFFRARNVTEMPYIEIYQGSKLVDSEVIPPTGLERFQQMLGAAQERLAAAAYRQPRSLMRQLLRQRRELERPKPRARGKRREGSFGSDGTAQSSGSALSGWLEPDRRGMTGSKPFKAAAQAQRSSAPRRAAPLRGATGGRRRGARTTPP